MTRGEAIKIINCYDLNFYDLSGEKIPADKLADAFDMAIEALSAEKTWEWVDFDLKPAPNGVPVEKCGNCGEWSTQMGKNFCPNCGAKMGGDTE